MESLEIKLESLKADLKNAWANRNINIFGTEETALFKRVENSKMFFKAIDPENMISLIFFFKNFADGKDSMLSFSIKIIDNKFKLSIKNKKISNFINL